MSRGSYRAIHTVLIDGPDYQALSPDAKLVFLTLKLNLGPTGIDVLYLAVLEDQTGLPAERVGGAMAELEAAGWVMVERNVVWIVDGLRYEPSRSLDNANHLKEIAAHLESLPRLAIVETFRAKYLRPSPAPSLPPSPSDGIPDGIPDGTGAPYLSTEERNTEKRKTEKRTLPGGSDDAFESAWRLYPPRAGSNPKREAAEKWRARLGEGITAAVMLDGTRRYRAFCEATGKLHTEKVMQARRFYGPSREFEAPWTLPADSGDAGLATLGADIERQAEATRQWLAGRGRVSA